MSTINDKTTVELFVNGEQAEEALTKLKKRATDLNAAINSVGNDPKQIKKLQRELKQTEKEIGRVENTGKGTRIVLENIGNTNLYGLRNALKYLKKELAATKPNTEEWRAYAEQIQEVQSRINELDIPKSKNESLFDRMGDWAMKAWPLLDLAKQGIGYAEQFVEAFASMDSEMAGVRKFTGMTAEDVEALNEEFKKMDTRTSREALNQLAQEAGRLGKTSQEDVLGFVRAADQINVALDDLGDGATLTLSKLTGIFGDEAKYGTEQSLLKVGSVINELSQNCAASAPYLAEFASRMGGVGAQANMTIPQIMAYGAVLDSAGMNVEASSTALSQVIVRFMQEPAKYAKVAGMDVKKFSDMLKTDVNGAVIMFLDTLKSAGKIDTLAPMFKDMGENGSQAIATLSTLVANIDQVKAQQAVATQAFQDGISVTNEYNVQNTTAAAQLDKAKKAAHDFAVDLGQQLMPVMTGVLNLTNLGMQVLSTTIKFVFNHKAAIAALTAAIVFYTVATKAKVAIEQIELTLGKARLALTALQSKATVGLSVVTNALRLVYFRLTGQTVKATAAQEALGLAMKATPWGAILTAVTAAIAAYSLFKDSVSDTSDEYDALKDAQINAQTKYEEERLSLQENIKKIQEFNGTKDEEARLIDSLNQKYGPVFGTYQTLGAWLTTLKRRGLEYCATIKQQVEAEAKAERARQLIAEAVKLRESGDDKAPTKLDVASKFIGDNFNAILNWGARGTGSIHWSSWAETEAEVYRNYWDSMYDASKEKLAEAARLRQEAGEVLGTSTEEITVPTTTPVTPSGGYTSQIVARKEKAKQEAAKRRAEAKAKKEFKADLEAVTAAKISGETSLRKDMEDGNIDYEKALERRHEIETAFYDQALSVYEKHMKGKAGMMLEEDKEYQDLLLKKQKSDEDYEKSKRDLEIQGIKRRALDDENAVRFLYEKAGDVSLEGEIEMQAQLFAIRTGALQEQAQLYAEGSKERADLDLEIDALYKEAQMEREKLYLAAVSKLRNEYDKKSAAERFKLEKATFDALLDAKQISEEEYRKFLKALREKYNKEDDTERSEASDSTDEVAESYDKRLKILQSKLAHELLTHEEFLKKKQKLDKEYLLKGLDALKKNGGEWNTMFVDIYTSFAKLVKGLGGDTGATLDNIAKATAAVSSAVVAGMQIATEFAKAEAEIQTAAVEKRYKREIELAQGNSYKTTLLEKQKEKELAKIKNDASKKQFAMQVIQAVAQTATNAISAYGAALKTGPQGLILAPIAAAIAVAQGALQVALLKKQQQASEAQGYSKGGFTKPGGINEPAGIVHAGEWVASQKLLASPVARPLIDALDYAQRTNTIGTLRAADVSRSIRATDSLVRIAETDTQAALMVATVAQNAKALSQLTSRLSEPFVTVATVTGDQGIRRAQDDYARMLNNVTPKSKRR